MKILVFVNNYLPSYKSGGPVRSLSNLIACMPDYMMFHVACSDRDAGDTLPFSHVNNHGFNCYNGDSVLYLPIQFFSFLKKIFINVDKNYDAVYLNSLFNVRYTLVPLLLISLGFIKSKALIISPRGELLVGALQSGWLKKHIYLYLLRFLFNFKSPVFHSTSDDETDAIKKYFCSFPCVQISNLPPVLSTKFNHIDENYNEHKSHLNLVYVSRVTYKKNLKFLIESFKNISEGYSISLDIYGPANGKDSVYLKECLSVELPHNVSLSYKGPVPNYQLIHILPKYDFFVLPTKGENFGHAIVESLYCGTPVIISSFTPFNDVESSNSGFILDISDSLSFNERLPEFLSYKKNPSVIEDYINKKLNRDDMVNDYIAFFSQYS